MSKTCVKSFMCLFFFLCLKVTPCNTMDLVPTVTTFYDDLVAIMTHPPFQKFMEKHMASWSDTESCLLFMKLYQNLAQYTDDPSSIIPVIDRIMNNNAARRQTVACFRDFQQGKYPLKWNAPLPLKN